MHTTHITQHEISNRITDNRNDVKKTALQTVIFSL